MKLPLTLYLLFYLANPCISCNNWINPIYCGISRYTCSFRVLFESFKRNYANDPNQYSRSGTQELRRLKRSESQRKCGLGRGSEASSSCLNVSPKALRQFELSFAQSSTVENADIKEKLKLCRRLITARGHPLGSPSCSLASLRSLFVSLDRSCPLHPGLAVYNGANIFFLPTSQRSYRYRSGLIK